MKKEEKNGEILKTKPPKGEKSATSEKLEMRKEARKNLPGFPEPKKGEDISNGLSTEENLQSPDDIQPVDLEEICGNIWVCVYQIGALLKKDFEPLTPTVKKLLAPPSARLAKKYHVEKMMSDELMLAGILGVDITGRFLKKPKEEKK